MLFRLVALRNVGGAATISMRAEDDKGRWTVFNSLEQQVGNQALYGTVGWSKRWIVLDIPDDAHTLTYAMTLARSGEARFSGFSLEVVGSDAPLTTSLELAAPQNVDFAGS
jgi:hypothetical protein